MPFHSGDTENLKIGKVNRSNQMCFGTREVLGTDCNAKSYRMICLSEKNGECCEYMYGANGTGVFEKRCPKCQGGKAGIPY